MKDGLDAAGLHPYLFLQPLGYHTPDAGKQGFIDLPEFPFAMEPRIFTRCFGERNMIAKCLQNVLQV